MFMCMCMYNMLTNAVEQSSRHSRLPSSAAGKQAITVVQDGLEAADFFVVLLDRRMGGNTELHQELQRALQFGRPSLLLVHERLAQAAASHVVSNDLAPAREGDALLLAAVTRDDRPDGDGYSLFESQIRHLYLQVTGIPLPADSADPGLLIDLWKQIYSVNASPVAAWTGVVTAVLRDPAVITY